MHAFSATDNDWIRLHFPSREMMLSTHQMMNLNCSCEKYRQEDIPFTNCSEHITYIIKAVQVAMKIVLIQSKFFSNYP